MCSESNSPLVTSPRISFSHDLRNGDDIGTLPIEDPEYEAETKSSDSNPNQFDFSFSDGFVNESCSADELFSDGLIRPLQLDEKFVVSKHSTLSFSDDGFGFVNERLDGLIRPPHEKLIVSKHSTFSPLPNPATNEDSKEIIVSSVIESEQKHQSKSFWRIDRSSSVHCDNSYKKSSFWSLPLMSRSNSTGSVPSPRQILKENKKQNNSHKQLKNSSSSSSSFYMYQLSQKPPLKKNYGGSYGNGVWTNPALNVPPPYIAKGTANLFGLTSLFREKKDKKNKK